MQSRKENNGYWLVLSKGEEVKSAIEGWAAREGVAGAQVWGIGALTDVELAYYNPEKNQWTKKKFSGYYELLGFSGNINEDGLHAHAIIGDSAFNVSGGHFLGGTISALGEFFIVPTNPLRKNPLPGTQLKKTELNR